MRSRSPEETAAIASAMAKKLKSGSVLALFGDLGSGKTVFVKGFAKALGIDPESVISPTFVSLNIYEGSLPIFHFDLYRLKNEQEFVSQGFMDYLGTNGICLIEWAERIENLLPMDTVRVSLAGCGDEERDIVFQG